MPEEAYADGRIPGCINLLIADIEKDARNRTSNLAHEIAIYGMASTRPLGKQAVGEDCIIPTMFLLN